MKIATSRASRHCLRSTLLLLLLLPLAALPSLAQSSPASQSSEEDDSPDQNEPPSLFLSIDMNTDSPPEIMFVFDSTLSQKFSFHNALSSALRCPLENISFSRDEQQGATYLHARCDIPLHRSLFTHSGTINLQPLLDIQRSLPNTPLGLSLSAPRQDVIRCDPEPDHHFSLNPANISCFYSFSSSANAPAALHFDFGYSRARAARLFGILGFLLLLPIAFTFWFRRRALHTPDEAKPAVSFAYRRFLAWTALLGALLWWTALDLLHAADYSNFLLPFWKRSDEFAAAIFPWLLLWTPPLLVYFLCLALSSPMQSLRGTHQSPKETLNQSFWSVARFAFPLPLLILGFTELFNSPRLAVLFITAGILAGKFATARFLRACGAEVHALTSGELRDRAFALASKAGAKLHQLYVYPAARFRMANAFAHIAHNVLLTDYLVNNLSKSEVDAVVGHEIAHLQNKHLGKRSAIIFVVVLVSAFGLAFSEFWIPLDLPTGPFFYAILLLALFFISRRNEYAADAGSVKLTGDAESMITALARITRLNTMPLQWSKLNEKLLTHPSALRRIKRLAHTAGISEARTAELLSQSLSAPVDTYSLPATALPEGKLFSTRYKSQLAQRFGWSTILVSALLPAAVAFFAHAFLLAGPLLWLAYSLGFLLTLAAHLALFSYPPNFGLPRLEPLMLEKFRTGHVNLDASSILFVSLSPDSSPRIYEASWAWDLGFLSLSEDQLSYHGEETHFSLRRDEITSISLGPGARGWIPSPSVYISWRDSSGREGTFHLRPLTPRSVFRIAAHARLLARDLENWFRRSSPSANPLLVTAKSAAENRGAPAFGQVTGMSPRLLLRGRPLAREFLFVTFLAVGVILLFGLGFPISAGMTRNPDSLDAAPSLGGLYVLLVAWLTRVFVLLPYWRAPKRSSELPSPAVPATSHD